MEHLLQDRIGVIYVAIHREDGKAYIGLTVQSLDERIKNHVRSVRLGSKTHFHNALRLYGTEAFEWCVLETSSDLPEAEQFYIAYLRALGAKLYNMTPGGDGVVNAPEVFAKIKAAWTPEKRFEQGRKMFGDNNPMRNPKVVARARVSISRGTLGIKKSEQHCANISKSKRGSLNPMYGKTGSTNGNALDEEKCQRIHERLALGQSITRVAKEEKTTRSVVRQIKSGAHWSCSVRDLRSDSV